MKKEPKLIYSRNEMKRLNIELLKSRGVTVNDIAQIAFDQQSKYTKGIDYNLALESVDKILSFREVFHKVQLGIEIDRLAEEKMFRGPIQDILYHDFGLFGVDEVLGTELSGYYGIMGRTNFGYIDIIKPGIVDKLNEEGKKEGVCHTFLDDIVGAIAAAASSRIAQLMNEKEDDLPEEPKAAINVSIFDLE